MINLTNFAASACSSPNFLGFPTWYAYLPKSSVNGQCTPSLTSINDIWLIVAAVIEILLRVAALAAVFMVIYGGVAYTTSQGEPDKTSQAQNTIINALVGLLIAVMAAAFVQFVAGKFSASS